MNPKAGRTRNRFDDAGVRNAERYNAIASRHLSNQHDGHEARMNEHIARAEAAGARGVERRISNSQQGISNVHGNGQRPKRDDDAE
jgi:hypothetical protein